MPGSLRSRRAVGSRVKHPNLARTPEPNWATPDPPEHHAHANKLHLSPSSALWHTVLRPQAGAKLRGSSQWPPCSSCASSGEDDAWYQCRLAVAPARWQGWQEGMPDAVPQMRGAGSESEVPAQLSTLCLCATDFLCKPKGTSQAQQRESAQTAVPKSGRVARAVWPQYRQTTALLDCWQSRATF